MKIAVDIDNTITLNPKKLQRLMRALKTSGNEVNILTGNADKEVPYDVRMKQLADLGLINKVDFDYVYVVNGDTEKEVAISKAEILMVEEYDIFIDDSLENIARAKKRNKNLLCLLPY